VRAWRGRDSMREPAAMRGWLRAIVVRECLRSLRRRAVRAWFVPLLVEVADPARSAEGLLGDAEVRRRLRLAADRLPARQRVAWGLRFDEGLGLGGIAETMGCTPDTVRTHLGRALVAIQREVNDVV